tara:strand:- start:410 stop:1327 length:918 start_codon:yes stop_codon:yes gene_type:complete
MKLTKLVSDYYSSYEYKDLRDITKTQYAYFLGVMLHTVIDGQPLREYKLENITTKMAKLSYTMWCDKGISMANHIMSVTRTVFNYGLREEYCLLNPFANVRRRSTDSRKVVWSRADIEKLLSTAYSDFNTRNVGLIAHMAYEWCQRLGDMRVLTWDNINFDTQTVHIEQSKRRAEVHLPISDDLFAMLKQQEKDFGFQPFVAPRPKPYMGEYRPYSLQKLPIAARNLMNSAGLSKELRLADLRRTGTTEMVEAGVGIAQIMSVTGHANPASVKPYIKNTLKSAEYALTERNLHGKSMASAEKKSI